MLFGECVFLRLVIVLLYCSLEPLSIFINIKYMQEYIPSFLQKNILYFLTLDNKLVYIGQSKGRGDGRICEHFIERDKFNKKKFDKSYVLILSNELNIDDCEKALITYFKPEFNKTGYKYEAKRMYLAQELIKQYNLKFDKNDITRF